MTMEKQILNGFTEMMRGFWNNQELEVSNPETPYKQEPCEDEYIKIPKKALKYRTAGMVAYNTEWLKDHFDIERAVICGAQEPYDNAISRKAVLDYIYNDLELGDEENGKDVERQMELERFYRYIKSLPPVTPQPKMGHWVDKDIRGSIEPYCSVCGDSVDTIYHYNYCPNCGTKMVEPRAESKDKK